MAEEVEVERGDALGYDVKEDEGERDKRQYDGGAAEDQHGIGKTAPPEIAHQAAFLIAGRRSRGRRCLAIDQISMRDNELMMSVMTKSTKPISTSALR